jgi:hypothetical protein
MIHRYMRYDGHWLTIRAWPYGHRGYFDVIMGLRSNGYFVTSTLFTNGGHSYGFASSVGHLRLDSVKLPVYDYIYKIMPHQFFFFK